MKKTINTSIGRIAFILEEDAHDKLAAYIDAISNSLKGSEGHDEIIADIESRIAEILQQKITGANQVVTITEIDEVISIMGKPEDFGGGHSTGKDEPFYTSGEYTYAGRRRVFRDPDDKVISGVCSGLAHHFGIDPIWLRLAFGLSIFIGGFGIILYLLLIIITPKARTAAEKLEMMGEPVDVNNIRKIFEEDMSHFKKKAKDFTEDMKSGRGNDRAKEFGKNLGDFFSSAGHGVGNVLGGIIKGILTFIGLIIAFTLAVVLIALIVSLTSGVNVIHIESGSHHMMHYSLLNFMDMLSVRGDMRVILITGILLFVGIPLLGLIVRFSRAAFGIKSRMVWFNITASILWAAGWIFVIIGIASVSSHFSVNDFTRNDNKIMVQPPAKMLYLKMPARTGSDNEDASITLDSMNVYISDENEFMGTPSLCIEQSPDSNYHLIETKIARGINKAEADNFANGINYNYTNHDSTLTLEPEFSIDVEKGWRKQKLELTLQVPLNESVALPEGIDHVLCYSIRKKGSHYGGQKWTMKPEGLVQSL